MKPSLEHLGKTVYFMSDYYWVNSYYEDERILEGEITAIEKDKYVVKFGNKLSYNLLFTDYRQKTGWGRSWAFDKQFLIDLANENKNKSIKRQRTEKQRNIKEKYLNEQLQLALKIQSQGYIYGKLVTSPDSKVDDIRRLRVKGMYYNYNGGKKYPKIIVYTESNQWNLNKLGKSFFLNDPMGLKN